MTVLAFDTSSDYLSICLSGENLFIEKNISEGLRHSEYLVPVIQNLMTETNQNFDSLDLIVCSGGPGSFTGLRIGMSAAKGLSAGCGLPFVSVGTLPCLAYGLDFFSGAVIPLIDARKNRYYAAVFSKGVPVSDTLDISSSSLSGKAAEYSEVLFTGRSADLERFKSELKAEGGFSDRFNFFSRDNGLSGTMAELGVKKFLESGCDSENSGPLYVRKSDAELSLEKNRG